MGQDQGALADDSVDCVVGFCAVCGWCDLDYDVGYRIVLGRRGDGIRFRCRRVGGLERRAVGCVFGGSFWCDRYSVFAAKVAMHGIAGGVVQKLQGGKFGHGFLSAGVTQAFSGKIDGIDAANRRFSPSRVIAAALVGGSVSAATGGKFANGASTAAFAHAFGNALQATGPEGEEGFSSRFEDEEQPSIGRRILSGALDFAGKVWTLPNTIVGLAVGIAGMPFGATISIGNNAIQFENYPWGAGAITLGNSIIYARGTTPNDVGQLYGDRRLLNVGLHERGHTYQYQAFGPFFIPTYLLTGGIRGRNPFEQGANNYAGGGSWWPTTRKRR